MLLIVQAIESYANRITYLIGKDVDKKSDEAVLKILNKASYIEENRCTACKRINIYPIPMTLAQLTEYYLKKANPSFANKFNVNFYRQLLDELFQVRNAIIHNHLYEIEYEYNDNYELKDWTFKKIGDTNLSPVATKELRISLIPIKINFEDIFKALIIFDLFTNVSKGVFQGGTVNYNFMTKNKIEGIWLTNLREFLGLYFSKLDPKELRKELVDIMHNISNKFSFGENDSNDLNFRFEYESKLNTADTFLSHFSTCHNCLKESFFFKNRLSNSVNCSECGFNIKSTVKVVSGKL